MPSQRFLSLQSIPKPLRTFLRVNIGFFMACLLVEAPAWAIHAQKVYRSPFFVGVKFNDFLSFAPRFHDLHTMAFFAMDKLFPFSYPASASLVYAAFFVAGPAALPLFLSFTLLSFFVPAALFTYALRAQGVVPRVAAKFTVLASLFAFPFWFLWQRGNIEIVIFLLLAAGLLAFVKEHWYTAAFLFGIAASMKIVPIVYLGLFVSRRQYKTAFFAILVAASAELFSLWFIGPTISTAWHGLAGGMASFKTGIELEYNPVRLGFDHSLEAIYRSFQHHLLPTDPVIRYYVPCIGVFGCFIFTFRIVKLPFINQLLCLCVASILFPPVSFEYTLIHLYLVLALFALDIWKNVETSAFSAVRLTPFTILMAILVSPLSEFIWHGIRYDGQLKALLLLALFILALVKKLPTKWDSQKIILSNI